MANPYSAGTLTLQEAPSFAWRTNGLALSCLGWAYAKPRSASTPCWPAG